MQLHSPDHTVSERECRVDQDQLDGKLGRFSREVCFIHQIFSFFKFKFKGVRKSPSVTLAGAARAGFASTAQKYINPMINPRIHS
jgi:hypothetical protein